ncbi:unnamed protein product [Kuraishia capsulata CBS 1993]|uniref:Uncharacterized protein n=1 Tax=Kuraishia capsulata CBS 1993 TaxID=1382522 RepID=W6MWR0_9ASCO|nr:unnamed protein product [Kuraishia capsulata CBS 1993]
MSMAQGLPSLRDRQIGK